MVNTHTKKSDSTRTKYIKVYLLKIQENYLWMNYGKEYNLFLTVSSVQLLNCVWLFVTQRTAASQASCPSPTPRANSNSCLSSQWHRPTISSSVVSFSSCPQSFATSESFQMSQFFYIRWPKYWSFNFSICPSREHARLRTK